MLLFGLAWVASFFGPSLTTEFSPSSIHTQLDLVRTVSQQQHRLTPASEKGFPSQSVGLSLPSSLLVDSSAPGGNGLVPVQSAAPVSTTAATLLPSWLSSQNGILDFAQPLARWLTALSPRLQESADATAPLPAAALEGTFSCFPVSGNAGAKPVKKPSEAAAMTVVSGEAPVQYDTFSTWLRSCLLNELSDASKVESLAVRIEESLQAANWDGETVVPTIAENLPSGKVGDRLLFIVTPEISEDLGHNAEVVATQWVNELRIALGAAPMPLVESQIQMYDLEATGDYIQGEASWYGPYFQGRLTATGEIFDKAMFTAAHKDLPFDTFLRITNLITGNVLIVRINDRGPYVGDRIIDLSQGSAQYLGSPEIGVIPVTAEFMAPQTKLQASLPYRAAESDQDPLITMWRP